jgi:hypothetical protein
LKLSQDLPAALGESFTGLWEISQKTVADRKKNKHFHRSHHLPTPCICPSLRFQYREFFSEINHQQVLGTETLRDRSSLLTAPYIWVWLFLKSSNNGLDSLIRDWPFWDYADIYNLLEGNASPSIGTRQNFELSCACMRAIRSGVLEDGKSTKLSSVHFGARLNGDREIRNLSLNVCLSANRHSTKATSANQSNWEVKCRDEKVVNVRACKDCIMDGEFFCRTASS